MPVILLATNRQSSAVGVRPRGNRIEVTLDFTPDPALMLATCAFIAGAMETVLRWEDFGLKQLGRHGLPRITRFHLRKHSSRRGWRVTADSLGQNPFVSNINEPLWKLRDGRKLSLRAIAAETLRPFRQRIRQISDSRTLEHIAAVFGGDARSLLDFEKRPDAYDDVGHGIDWGRRRMRRWPRSKYEKVIHRVIAREPIRIEQKRYQVDRMNGWYRSNFEKWELNVAARLISMSLCGWRLQKSQPRWHRANAKTAKSVAPKRLNWSVCCSHGPVGRSEQQLSWTGHRPVGYSYNPISSRTYFTGGLPYEITWSLYFLRLNWSPSFFCSAARKSRCSVAPTK